MVLLGDLNARVAKAEIRDEIGHLYEYRRMRDNTINDRGRTFVKMYYNYKMVVVNKQKVVKNR